MLLSLSKLMLMVKTIEFDAVVVVVAAVAEAAVAEAVVDVVAIDVVDAIDAMIDAIDAIDVVVDVDTITKTIERHRVGVQRGHRVFLVCFG